MTIPQLTDAVHMAGFSLIGSPGKAVSDSLRWAIQRQHVERVARGRYASGGITKQTRHRYRTKVAACMASATGSPSVVEGRAGHGVVDPRRCCDPVSC